MKLKSIYLQRIYKLDLRIDSLQLEAIRRLQEILDPFNSKKSKLTLFNKPFTLVSKGLYIWGDVGRGKTFIISIFYNKLTIKNKRYNFLHFMENIHAQLRKYHGKNPILKVAYDMAKQRQVICFNEFFVEDIADTMILGSIFTELFKFSVVLVITSNIELKKLYKNGLQRKLFLSAIDILLKNVDVLNLDSGVDYRFCFPTEYLNYLYPYNEHNYKNFFNKFFLRNSYFNKILVYEF